MFTTESVGSVEAWCIARSMHNLSMVQALSIWSDLEAAFFGKNRYGGNTAEIYLYRALTHCPSLSHDKALDLMSNPGSLIGENIRDAYDDANAALHDLFAHFSRIRSAQIEVEGRELGDWLKTARFTHRIHVKVTNPNERRFTPGSTFLMNVPKEPVAIGNFQADVMQKLEEADIDGPYVRFVVSNDGLEVHAVEED